MIRSCYTLPSERIHSAWVLRAIEPGNTALRLLDVQPCFRQPRANNGTNACSEAGDGAAGGGSNPVTVGHRAFFRPGAHPTREETNPVTT